MHLFTSGGLGLGLKNLVLFTSLTTTTTTTTTNTPPPHYHHHHYYYHHPTTTTTTTTTIKKTALPDDAVLVCQWKISSVHHCDLPPVLELIQGRVLPRRCVKLDRCYPEPASEQAQSWDEKQRSARQVLVELVVPQPRFRHPDWRTPVTVKAIDQNAPTNCA